MELSFAKCESIVNSLPIGFYTGRRIPIVLERDAETSFYSPMEDKIIVSYPIIAHRMSQSVECDEEEAVRSMLYHEVSHAILTPAKELHNSFQLNCFEDERIETVLRHYYHGVDFRKQLYDIHGGSAPKATNAEKAFFNAVRFGLGTPNVQKEVLRLLKQYASIDRTTQRWRGRPCAGDYEGDVDALYRLIQREYRSDPEAFQPKNDKETNGQEQPGNQVARAMAGDEQDENENGKDPMLVAGDKEGDENEEPHELEISEEQLKRMVGASLGSKSNLNNYQVERLNEFQRTAEIIIGNFNKKNKGGSGINAYSGVFNPRAVARKDYRYFERAMTTQGNNKFGSCHLNLIIDSSGSFCDNVPLTNGILAVLSEIERKNRNFSMDVAFINHSFHLCESVRERQMVADGGNTIPDNMKEILTKLQKPQTCNYNIILFDGDAICQGYYGKDTCKMFSVFDMKQTTLITDPDNEQYMKPAFTAAKVIVTKHYTDELIKHITNALTIAFG